MLVVALLVGERDARDRGPGILVQAPGTNLAGVLRQLLERRQVLELRVGIGAGEAGVRLVEGVELEELLRELCRHAIASADERPGRLGRNPPQVGTHGEVSCQLGLVARGQVCGRLAPAPLAVAADAVGTVRKEAVVPLEALDACRGEHAAGVMALVVQLDCLLEHLGGRLDELVHLLVGCEGEVVVDEDGCLGDQVERAVLVGLGERVAVLRVPAAKARERPGRAKGVELAHRAGEAQAKTLVVLEPGVV